MPRERKLAVKPSVYVETSVIGHCVSRPSRHVVTAGHQMVTRRWWEFDLPKFDAFISQVVLDEISAGDVKAAQERLTIVQGMAVLELTNEIEALAKQYFARIDLPGRARADAFRLALATSHGMDYLVTWNCKHIASARVRKLIEDFNDVRGLATPVICTPEELLEF